MVWNDTKRRGSDTCCIGLRWWVLSSTTPTLLCGVSYQHRYKITQSDNELVNIVHTNRREADTKYNMDSCVRRKDN
jgi:hypothetical protein